MHDFRQRGLALTEGHHRFRDRLAIKDHLRLDNGILDLRHFRLWVPALRWAIADAVMEAGGGHNGIMVEADGGSGCHIDHDWGEVP